MLLLVRDLLITFGANSLPPGLLPKWPHGSPRPIDPDRQSNLTSPGPVVTTANGPVRGVFRGIFKKSIAWWGIPFAEPPVRLMAPQPLRKTWTEPFDAKKLSANCMDSEDCLYLNVYAPSAALAEKAHPRPVMFWIYGGGYVSGDSSEFGLYDGQHLSESHEIVLVTVNYRLGNLGFMALDALRLEDPNGSTGNYGMQDQNLALKWVQTNIASFGGDPGRVTIFGESAGGMSVMWHLVSPMSKGLFHAAIMESGTSAASFFFQPYKEAASYYEDTAKILKCPAEGGATVQLRCLRALSMDDIQHGAGGEENGSPIPADRSPLYPIMPVGPVIDGTEAGLLDVPIHLVESGRFNKVPFILGANENGGSIFEPMLPLVVPHAKWPVSLFPQSFQLAFAHMFHGNSSKVEAIYSKSEYRGARFPLDSLISRAIRDLIFMCPLRSVASAWTKHGLQAFMYVFHFDYGMIIDNVTHLGDFHAGELPFVFDNWIWAIKALAPVSDPQLMANIMTCKWASFAYTHDPNGGADESKWPPNCLDVNRRYNNWPAYNLTERQFYSLRDAPAVHQIRKDNIYPDDLFPRDPKCDLWDSMSSNLRFEHDDAELRPPDFKLVV